MKLIIAGATSLGIAGLLMVMCLIPALAAEQPTSSADPPPEVVLEMPAEEQEEEPVQEAATDEYESVPAESETAQPETVSKPETPAEVVVIDTSSDSSDLWQSLFDRLDSIQETLLFSVPAPEEESVAEESVLEEEPVVSAEAEVEPEEEIAALSDGSTSSSSPAPEELQLSELDYLAAIQSDLQVGLTGICFLLGILIGSVVGFGLWMLRKV